MDELEIRKTTIFGVFSVPRHLRLHSIVMIAWAVLLIDIQLYHQVDFAKLSSQQTINITIWPSIILLIISLIMRNKDRFLKDLETIEWISEKIRETDPNAHIPSEKEILSIIEGFDSSLKGFFFKSLLLIECISIFVLMQFGSVMMMEYFLK